MTKSGQRNLAEGNLTKTELREAIIEILGDGEERTAWDIVRTLKGRGKTTNALKVAHMIIKMDNITKMKVTDVYGNMINYRYKRSWI